VSIASLKSNVSPGDNDLGKVSAGCGLPVFVESVCVNAAFAD